MGTEEPIKINTSNPAFISRRPLGFAFSIKAESKATAPKKTNEVIANPEKA